MFKSRKDKEDKKKEKNEKIVSMLTKLWENVEYNEQDRQQVDHYGVRLILNENFLAPVQEQLEQGCTVIDVGCGSGFWVLDVAADYPNCKVIGTDILESFPNAVMPDNVDFYQNDVLKRLPFEDNSIEFINQRHMLSVYKVAEWPKVIEELHRVLKPGCYLEMAEWGLQIQDDGPVSKQFSTKIIEALKMSGGDPCPSDNFKKYLEQSGFDDINITPVKIYLGGMDGVVGGLFAEEWRLAYENIQEWIKGGLKLSQDEFDKKLEEVVKEWKTHKSYVNIYICYARKK